MPTTKKTPAKSGTDAARAKKKTTKPKKSAVTAPVRHGLFKRLHIRITKMERLSLIGLAALSAVLTGAGAYAVIAYAATSATTLYVSTTGSDQNNGTSAKPLATLAKALEKTSPDGTILLADGSYPMTTITKDYAGLVISGRNKDATLAGLDIKGASRVNFRNLNFNGPVKMENGNSKLTNSTANLLFENNKHDPDFKSTCFRIVNSTHDITIKNSSLLRCNSGIVGPGRANHTYRSYNINVINNVIDRTKVDGMQFGDWDNVVISGNSITNNGVGEVPKEDQYHPDAIQITGRSSSISIRNNKLGPSRSQVMMVQSSIGPVDNVTVTNNKIGPAYGVAYQNIGVSRLVISKNVICGNDGGLWIKGASNNATKNDAVVTDNIIQMEVGSNTYNLYAPATIGAKTNNLGGIKTNTGNTLRQGTCDQAQLAFPATGTAPGGGPGVQPSSKQKRSIASPSNVTATPTKDGTIAVTWQWSGNSPDKFQVILNGKVYATPVGTNRSFTITGLENGSVNTVKVLAELNETDVYLKAISGSNPSSGITTTVPDKVTAPTNVTLVQTSAGKIVLKWNYVTSPNVKYRIYADGRRIATMDGSARSYSMSGRTIGTEYKLTMTAIDYSLGGIESKPVTVSLTPTY